MDYEKKYNDALNLAKSYYGKGSNEFLDTMFPELRESEDERINKAIQKYLDWLTAYPIYAPRGEYSIRDMLHYLYNLERKQKEQKLPITGNDFGWIDELKHDLEHPEELDQKVDDVLKQRNGTRALEWSEEDELNCNRIIRFLEPHKTFFPMKETKEEMQNWLKNRLKSLRPSWKPSEEQMRVLKQVEDRVAMKSGYWEQVLDSLYCDLQKL